MVLFAGAIVIALLRGRRPDCGCFGQLYSAPAGWGTLARTAALAALAGLVAARPAEGPRWILLAAVGAGTLSVLQALLSYRLLRRYGRALRRIDELEAGVVPSAGLEVGAQAPEFSLRGLHGAEVTLAGLLARGRQVLLVFTDPGCGPCRALLPDLASWQREHAARLTLALISRGERSESAAVAEAHGLDTVLLQQSREVAELYGTEATPSALLVGADGRVARPLAGGASAIEGLVRSLTATERPAHAPSANGARRVAAAAAVAGGLALATSPARGARTPSDPDLQAIDKVIKKAAPRLETAAQRASKAVLTQATLRHDEAARAKRAAAVRAIAAERREVLALRTTLEKLDLESVAAQRARTYALESLSLFGQALEKQGRALLASPKEAERLLDDVQKLVLRSLPPGVQAGRFLGRGQ
jgi:methylamine dehydrogenase accessory protein MauD